MIKIIKKRLAFYSNNVQDVCTDNSQLILKLVLFVSSISYFGLSSVLPSSSVSMNFKKFRRLKHKIQMRMLE